MPWAQRYNGPVKLGISSSGPGPGEWVDQAQACWPVPCIVAIAIIITNVGTGSACGRSRHAVIWQCFVRAPLEMFDEIIISLNNNIDTKKSCYKKILIFSKTKRLILSRFAFCFPKGTLFVLKISL